MIDGIVVIDKPVGWTSHDVVGKLRHVYGQRRVGHAGTLDPPATGVLLVGLGRATRLLQFLTSQPKEYVAEVVFGIGTDTLDAAGKITVQEPMSITREDVATASKKFLGNIEQIPPMVSAIKIDGKHLYELAREGQEIERKPRSVQIHEIEVQEFAEREFPSAVLRIRCSSGTYIRSLALDIGVALGGVAHVKTLRRTAIGSFTLKEAHTVEDVEAHANECLLTPAQAMRDYPSRTLTSEEVTAAQFGKALDVGMDDDPQPVAALDDNGQLIGVYQVRESQLHPIVVLFGH